MIILILIILAIVIAFGVVSYFFGAHTAGSHWQRQLLEVRIDAQEREAAMHRLSAQALSSMANEIDRLRPR